MIENIIKWIPQATPLSIPRWDKFVYLLKLNANRYRSQYINDQYLSTNCTKLFEQILINIPVSKFLTEYTSDYARLSAISDALVRNLASGFDPIVNLKNFCNILINSKNKIIPEYYLNVECSKPFTYLPLDKPWTEWAKLKSVRILHHDSRELCTDLLGMQLTFKKHQPTYLLASIDLPAMILQYVKFLEYHNSQLGSDLDYRAFIKYHIIEPWYDDLIKIWLFNVFQDIVYNEFKLFKLFNAHGVISRTKLKAAKSHISIQTMLVKNSQLSIGRFLSAKWLGNISILEWLDIVNNVIIIPPFAQYDYLRFILELPYIKLIVHLCILNNTDETKKILKEINHQLTIYTRTNISNKIVNPGHKAFILKEISELSVLLKNT